MKTFWIATSSLLAAVTFGWAGFSLFALTAREDVSFNRTFSDPGDTLNLDISGTVTVLPGDDGKIHIEAKGYRGFKAPAHSETFSDGKLSIKSRCHNIAGWCELNYTVRIPASMNIVATSIDGTFRSSGITGNIDVRTVDGNITVDGAKGFLKLHTSDGRIRANNLSAENVDLQSGDGSIRASFISSPQVVTTRSNDGSTHLKFVDNLDDYNVDINTGDGTSHNEIRTNTASNRLISAHAGDGNITLTY